MITLNSIENNNMIFISAQPDNIYFHWQVELYLYQFSKLGIADRCYAIFGYNDSNPSADLVNLSKKFKNILWYKDERDKSIKNYYIPTIRPHILKKFFKEYSHLGKNVFYHDSDIFLVKLPKFELMFDNDIGYVSDTVSYIGYKYIRLCGKRYKEKYPELSDDDIFIKMCKCINISEDLVRLNEKDSGGAQYLLKNIDSSYWEEVEKSCVKLYDLLKKYENTYPINNHIQSWTTDMWVVLWTYWKRGSKTIVHTELDFSWATGTMLDYHSKNIFHCAGVTLDTCNDKFYKGNYINRNVFIEYIKDNTIFDHISKDNATFGYISMIKEYANNNINYFSIQIPNDKTYDKFEITSSNGYDGEYIKDINKSSFGKLLWRSNNGYIIFYNSSIWILTHSQYENEISETCGGFCSNTSIEPYENHWNIPCSISIIK